MSGLPAERRLLGQELAEELLLQRQPEQSVVARQHRRPRAARCRAATVTLRPVFFRSTARGPRTGATWPARLAAANSLWGRCGIRFAAGPSRTVVDPEHVTAGDDRTGATLIRFERRHAQPGSGPEVFFVDNDLGFLGGGGTHGRGDSATIEISDSHGGNVLLLAHELGHAMGFDDWIHSAPYALRTVMQPSASNAVNNPDVVTALLCGMLQWPQTDPRCFRPDPDPAPAGPPQPVTGAEPSPSARTAE